ncbi:MAG TPA: nucleoside deaminase [Bacteroidales bacterium]|nr:nucleoside deaminase [Bacteroidales bacterium]
MIKELHSRLRSDEHYMKAALREAEIAFSKDEVPVGVVVVCNNMIIARAHNLTETLNDPTAHAEMQAITAAASFTGGKYLGDCTFYISVEPCIMCAGALFWSQAGRIVFGASDEKRGFGTAGSPILHPRTRVSEGVLSSEAKSLMKEFFKKKR